MGNGMNKVLPGLYIGNFRDAKDPQQLSTNNITHILSIHDNAKPILSDKKYLCISVSDTPEQDLTKYFRECSQFIHESRLTGGGVLVHCLAGVSRSVTVTTAYLMTLADLEWDVALHTVRMGRTVASPNHGFQKQLQDFGKYVVSKEKKWFKSKYGETSPNDLEYINEVRKQAVEQEKLSKEHEETRVHVVGPSSGSVTSTPVNKQDDFYMFPNTTNRNGSYFGQ